MVTQTLLIVVFAGISEAIGQSVVLFANRVVPARFALSLVMNALLIAAGYTALVVCTWLSFLLPGQRQIGFMLLATTVAVSYAPLLLAFLGALPYAGNALMWALRVAQLVAMVTGVAAAAYLTLWLSAAHVAAGWAVKLGLRQAFSRPFAALTAFLTDAAAGKTIEGEAAAVQDATAGIWASSAATTEATSVPASKRLARHGTPVFAGVIVTCIAVPAILIALTPLRIAIAHAYAGLIVVRVGFDLVWIAIAAIIIAAFLAPLETLGWWAGWYGDGVDADHPAARAPARPLKGAGEPSRYIVYLDGISQSSAAYTPDVETFFDALEPELPAGMLLVRGIMAYSVLNRPLEDDPMYARFWSWVELVRGGAKTAILGMFINIRNVMIVAVSADARYGPMYNLGIAQVVYNQLVQRGYRPQSGIPITLIGYSGGGQMSAETGPLLKRVFAAPLDIISLAGVMTGTCAFAGVDRLHHMYGSKDVVEPFGPIMFASRWRIMSQSNWNRALRAGIVTIAHLGPVGHQVPGGLLDPAYTLPDGRSALRQTLDQIHALLVPQPAR